MASVTQRITNFLGGVSRQPDDKKVPGQVRECLNSYPDPTYGLTKRPGTKFIKSLSTTANQFQNARWFYISRDGAEKYIGCFTSTGINIWNVNTGVAATVTYLSNAANYLSTAVSPAPAPRDYLQVLTVQDTTIVVNKTKVVAKKAAPSYSQNKKATIRIYDAAYGAEYKISIKVGPTTYTITPYVTKNAEPGTNSNTTNNKVLSVDDILTELETRINGLSIPNFTVTRLKANLELACTSSFTVTASGGVNGDALKSFQEEVTNISELPAESTIDRQISVLNTVNNKDTYYVRFITTAKSGFTGYISGTTLTVTSVGSGSIAVNDYVQSDSSILTKITALGTGTGGTGTYTVDVSQTAGNSSNQLTFAGRPLSGHGVWEETVKPGISTGLDESTMPHELINTAPNVFIFRPLVQDTTNPTYNYYEPRLVGDDETNDHPTFVDATIQQAFFYNNRLGFLTQDNVSMSQAGEFFNFYHTTALTTVASDPIDLSCSSLKPAVLNSVLPAAQGLVLFSSSQQFMMYADQGVLTPGATAIRSLSNYNCDTKINPVDVGTNMVFISKTPGYSRIYALATRGNQENPDVLDIGRIVSEWVPDTIDSLIASPQNSFVAMSGATSPYIYFFRTYGDSEKTLMQTWFNWKMPGNVQFCVADSDDFYVVTYQSGEYTLLKANLTQSPEDAILRSDIGQVVQLCLDMHATPSSITYNSVTNVNRCYLRHKDITGLEPAIVIADPNNTGQSGYTVIPTRGNDGNPYFEFVGDDYSSQASIIRTGFKYNFDVELPRYYYQLDTNTTDYTASLTIARMKFSIGLSSNIGFKLKARGRNEWYDVQSIQDADYYLANDIPLDEQNVYILPIHQRNDNFSLRVFSDSPFPVSLTSMMWEGRYSPRFYGRGK